MLILYNLFVFMKKAGLRQIIDGTTRPKRRGGSCIDLILTECTIVMDCGILNDFVSDHYTVYCTREKKKEHHTTITRTIRDYRAFDKTGFENLLIHSDWSNYDKVIDPDVQWEIPH